MNKFPDTSENNQPIKRPSSIPVTVNLNIVWTAGLDVILRSLGVFIPFASEDTITSAQWTVTRR